MVNRIQGLLTPKAMLNLLHITQCFNLSKKILPLSNKTGSEDKMTFTFLLVMWEKLGLKVGLFLFLDTFVLLYILIFLNTGKVKFQE